MSRPRTPPHPECRGCAVHGPLGTCFKITCPNKSQSALFFVLFPPLFHQDPFSCSPQRRVPVSRVLLAVSGRCRAASPSPPCCAWPIGMGKQQIFPVANPASFPAQTTPTGAHSFFWGSSLRLHQTPPPYRSQVCRALLRRHCALH